MSNMTTVEAKPAKFLLCFFRLPASSPIVGMALSLLWMQASNRIDTSVASASDALLTNVAVLFVPVGVGAMV